MAQLGNAPECSQERHIMFTRAIYALVPEARASVEFDTIIDWDDSIAPQPTQAEIEAKVAELEAAEPLRRLRQERDKRLAATDWVSGADVPQAIKDLWFPYRQALRDITETYTSLDDVVWPAKPE